MQAHDEGGTAVMPRGAEEHTTNRSKGVQGPYRPP